jgi:hypothetical protein
MKQLLDSPSFRSMLSPTVPLDHSALCLDCEAVFCVGQHSCPRCASDHWTPLARFLNRNARAAAPGL